MSLVTINQEDILSELIDEVLISIDYETTGRPIYTLETLEVSTSSIDDWAPTSIRGQKEVRGQAVDLLFSLNRMTRGTFYYDVEII